MDPTEDAISGAGMVELAAELGIEFPSFDAVVLCWVMACASNDRIKWEEFERATLRLNVDSLAALKPSLSTIRMGLSDIASESFKSFYAFCFSFLKDPTQKSMSNEMAVMSFQLVLQDRYPMLDRWLVFLRDVFKRAVTRDSWAMFVEFAAQYPTSVADYREDFAWPSVIDEYVEWIRRQGRD